MATCLGRPSLGWPRATTRNADRPSTHAFPANFKAYEAACKKQAVRLGEVFVFDNGQLMPPRWIINFPTKGHWRARSRIRDVAEGIDDLRDVIEELEICLDEPPLR